MGGVDKEKKVSHQPTNSTLGVNHHHHYFAIATRLLVGASESVYLWRPMARAVSQTRGKREIATTTPTASRSISPREDEQPEASPSRTRPRPSYTASLQSEDLKESSPAYASPPAETQFRSHGEDSDDQLWEADCILDERGAVATGQYLVQWVGNDPSTGSRWEPTWERREDVTPLLAKEWKDKKKADPSIVGVEGKKLELAIKAKREEAKKEKKRKRDEKANNARKKAKARSTRMLMSFSGSCDC